MGTEIPVLTACLAVESQDRIGEGPAWDAAGNRFIWVDHEIGIIQEAKTTDSVEWRETRRWTPGGMVSSAIPRARGGLVVAGANEIYFLDDSGVRSPFVQVAIDGKQLRMSDAKCDRRGRLWVGTISIEFKPRASLYRCDPEGSITKMLDNVILSNGLDWSPDGSTFYFIDSLKCSVDAFDFNMDLGTISNRRTFLAISPDDGVPNGMAVDSEGCLWVALTCGGEVRRFAPDGTLLARVRISVPGVTSCAFGGTDGGDLFITSRSGRVPEVIKELGVKEEKMESLGTEAGSVFVCRPGISGPPATPFAG